MEQNNKRKSKNTRLYLILFIVLALQISIPLLINWLYSRPESRITTIWNGVEILQYVGTILGGLVTFSALYITIKKGEQERENERKLDSRVFLTVDSYILFDSFKDFSVYAEKVGAYRAYLYPQWIRSSTNSDAEEYDYITEHGRYKEDITKNSTQKRIAGILVENCFDKPVMNLKYNMDVTYNDGNKNEPKHYGDCSITVFSPSQKIFFLLPVGLGGKNTRVDSVSITYETIANEEISYTLSSQMQEKDNNKWIEKYSIIDVDSNNPYSNTVDKNNSSSYIDIRKYN